MSDYLIIPCFSSVTKSFDMPVVRTGSESVDNLRSLTEAKKEGKAVISARPIRVPLASDNAGPLPFGNSSNPSPHGRGPPSGSGTPVEDGVGANIRVHAA